MIRALDMYNYNFISVYYFSSVCN